MLTPTKVQKGDIITFTLTLHTGKVKHTELPQNTQIEYRIIYGKALTHQTPSSIITPIRANVH